MRTHAENDVGKGLCVTCWKSSTWWLMGIMEEFCTPSWMVCVRLSRHTNHIKPIKLEGHRLWLVKSQIRAMGSFYKSHTLSWFAVNSW